LLLELKHQEFAVARIMQEENSIAVDNLRPNGKMKLSKLTIQPAPASPSMLMAILRRQPKGAVASKTASWSERCDPTLITVIPVFNGARYIAQTLQSVARQTRRPDRCIILDNCSTDDTREVVCRFHDMECEWHENPTNLGLFGNFNRALDFAKEADYLHILCADDMVKPTFYQRCIEVSRQEPGRAMIYSQTELVNQEGNHLPFTYLHGSPPRRARSIAVKKVLIARAELRAFYPGVVLKTNRQSSPCHFLGDVPHLGDHIFWGTWATHCSQVFELPDVLFQYRLHETNETKRNAKSLQAYVADEWRAMQIMASLLAEHGLKRWYRIQKLKCIFAARSQVKIRETKDASPDFAARIEKLTKAVVGTLYWGLGDIAVTIVKGTR